MTHELTPQEQIIEEMVQRRVEDTGEDRRTASLHVKRYICQALAPNLIDEVL